MEIVPVIQFWRSVEALFEVASKLVGLIIVYMLFEFVGEYVVGSEFQTDTLLSLVVLPAIYVLKDLGIILEPYFVEIWKSNDLVKVESGILTQRVDNLALKNVENVELIRTPLGRIFGYTTLCIYAYGSWVELPFVKADVANLLYEKLGFGGEDV